MDLPYVLGMAALLALTLLLARGCGRLGVKSDVQRGGAQ